MKIEYHPAVADELEQIRDYYEDKSVGLGKVFVDELEHQLFNIAAMPSRWMVVRGDVRRSLMKRFPYVILFRSVDDEIIRVTVVKHEKRHPAFGLGRR